MKYQQVQLNIYGVVLQLQPQTQQQMLLQQANGQHQQYSQKHNNQEQKQYKYFTMLGHMVLYQALQLQQDLILQQKLYQDLQTDGHRL